MRPWAILALLLAIFTTSGTIYRPSHPIPWCRPVVNLPLSLFWGIAHAESDFYTFAIGPDGFDHGFWQVRSFYNVERGIKNAFDPIETTRWAVGNFTKNLDYFRSVDKAISAHKRGRDWVRKHGIDREYIAKVKGDE
jgi:hypothetical protein